MRRNKEDEYVMLEQVDYQSANDSKKVAIIERVKVSREGGFTCPLETFLVFVSEEYVDIEDEEFARYNDLKTYEQVKNAFGGECGPIVQEESTCYSEFLWTERKLKPVVWGKFTKRAGVLVNVQLKQVFAAKYLYMKLINPEDRMAEMNDMNQFTNIDCNYIVTEGKIIELENGSA